MNPNKPKLVHMFIRSPQARDVITGRGNGPKVHTGNVAFRNLVKAHKAAYYGSSNDEKKRIVLRVIQLVQSTSPSPPGRFLTDECGIWKLMDQKNIFRKVGQALREQQGRLEVKGVKEMNDPSGKNTRDIPPRIINVAPPAGQMTPRIINTVLLAGQMTPRITNIAPRAAAGQMMPRVIYGPINTAPPRIINAAPNAGQMKISPNQIFKRRITHDFIPNTQIPNKIPRLGETDIHDTHESHTHQYQIGAVKEEMALLQKQVSILRNRVAFLERQNHGSEKTIVNDRNFSYARPTPSPHIIPNSSAISTTSRVKISPGQTQSPKKYYRAKPSLHSFSQALTSSIRGISNLDNAEDVLFDILTKSVSEQI